VLFTFLCYMFWLSSFCVLCPMLPVLFTFLCYMFCLSSFCVLCPMLPVLFTFLCYLFWLSLFCVLCPMLPMLFTFDDHLLYRHDFWIQLLKSNQLLVQICHVISEEVKLLKTEDRPDGHQVMVKIHTDEQNKSS
jgi:hypothetical protein